MANHWSHILSMKTDFYINYLTTEQKAIEYPWFDSHYDGVYDGDIAEHKSRNPSIKQFPYGLLATVIQPGEEEEDIETTYNDHMAAWYADPLKNTEEYDIEDAFLHNYVGGARKEVTIWENLRYVMYPGDPGLKVYQSARINEIITTPTGGYYPDGVFIDEHASLDNAFQTGDDYVEYHASGDTAAQFIVYKADETLLLIAIKTVIGSSKRMLLNTDSYIFQIQTDWILAAGGAHLEAMNSAYRNFWDWDYYGFLDTLLAQDVLIDFSGQPYGENPDGYNAGNSDSATNRHQLWKLANYYTVVDSDASKLAFSVNDWVYPEADRWIGAIEINVGHPTQVRQSYQTGTDGNGKDYIVYSRDMDNALILNRPAAHAIYDETSLIAVALPGTDIWYPLSSAGVLGSAITSINLRNAEGAILMKGSVMPRFSILGGFFAKSG